MSGPVHPERPQGALPAEEKAGASAPSSAPSDAARPAAAATAPADASAVRAALACGAFAAAYCAAWFLSTTVPMRLVWYLPVERRFTFEVHPVALGADFYGRLLLCALCGALGALASRLLSPRHLRTAWVWAAVLLLFTAGLYGRLLSTRQPVPAPLPEAYVPR
jgi:hypothetical protein